MAAREISPSHGAKRLDLLEETIGTNWAPKVGVGIIVIGLGLLTAHEWSHVASWWQIAGPWLRTLIVLLGGLSMLFGGIAFETTASYRILGRAMIGGGWATTFLVAYAMRHAPAFTVLSRDSLDLLILLAVVGAMVWHTLKYSSQTVTGLAFLLGFAAVTLNPNPPFNLVAGAFLITGMTVIVLRRQWYEFEVLGILASYGNHFYWLYSAFHTQQGFGDHTASVALMIVYWTIFRTSYLAHKISHPRQETISTLSALLNPLLFLGVMKYQSFHTEWAFQALLIMGTVEFFLGQLPVSRNRHAPFQTLSSLGAALTVVALPFRYAGNANELVLMWLTGAELFLLTGILSRERLFRGFGLIISLLIALYSLPVYLTPLAQKILSHEPLRDFRVATVLGAIALALYVNAHLTRSLRPQLFEHNPERALLRCLSYFAAVFTTAAVYASTPEVAVGLILAAFVLILSWAGKRASLAEWIYQGHGLAAVAVTQVMITRDTLTARWLGVPARVVSFSVVAAVLYWSSRFVGLSESFHKANFSAAYAWSATTLLGLLIWYQGPAWAIASLWIVLALGLAFAGHGLQRKDMKWHAFALMWLSAGRSLTFNFDLNQPFYFTSLRLVTVGLTALGSYLLIRWAPLRRLRPLYSSLGTILLSALAFRETKAPWTAVAWISLALVLGLAGRLWKDRALLWQTHALAALAVAWTFYINFAPQYRGSGRQLISVGVTASLLYILAPVTNVAGVIEDYRMTWAYPWAGSLLLSCLAWYQVNLPGVSLVWGAFGLVLFELPTLVKTLGIDASQSAGNWRAQSYVALFISFAHLFYANFNSPASGNFVQILIEPRLVTVYPLLLIYFGVYWRMHEGTTFHTTDELAGRTNSANIVLRHGLACLGTATVVALVGFEVEAEMVAVGYATIVFALLVATWCTRHEIFFHQTLVVLGFAAVRVSMHNFHHLHEPFSRSFEGAALTIGILAAGVPVALRLRSGAAKPATRWPWVTFLLQTFLLQRPEQPIFFVPVILLAVLLFLKLSGGMVTLAWGVEGIVVFILSLWAKERSFRLAGLGLVIASVGKIGLWDAWQFADSRRYMALIGVGVILLAVSFLYGKNREALREYL
jgi:hypothetical protein